MNIFESGWTVLYTEEEWQDYLDNLGNAYVHYGQPYDYPNLVKSIFIPAVTIDGASRAKHVFVYQKDGQRVSSLLPPPLPSVAPPVTAPQTPSAKTKSGEYRLDLPEWDDE